jgi:hypothetical protein
MCYCNPKIPLPYCKSNKCQYLKNKRDVSICLENILKKIEKHEGMKFDFCKGNSCWCAEAKKYVAELKKNY